MIYKVSIRKDGAIASCEQISESFENGNSIYCIDANSPADAITAAKALWLVRYKNRSIVSKNYNRKLREAGLCIRCKTASAKTYCQDCIKKKREYKRSVKRGEIIVFKRSELTDDEKIAIAQRRSRKIRELNAEHHLSPHYRNRLTVLRKLLAVYDNDPHFFRMRLVEMITELESKNRHAAAAE